MSCALVQAQDKSKMFGPDEFVWCGLDYSNAKCIGSYGFTDPHAIKNKHIAQWNGFFFSEPDKYDLKKTYLKEKQINDLSVVNRRNGDIDLDELVTDDSYEFEDGTLSRIIKDYDLEKADKGLGLVYVVESLNKNTESAVIHTVFFDIASKEIIWSHKFDEKAGGFGFRNYWARPIYNVLKESKAVYKRAK